MVVAVGLGAYLIDIDAPHVPASPTSSNTAPHTQTTAATSTTTTIPGTSTTTAPTGARPSPTVKVLVANASQTNGIAAYYTGKLSAAGWGTLTPATADSTEASSAVYYSSGEKPYALAIAAALGVPSSSVGALTPAVPVSTTANAEILVVAGDDLAAKVPAAAG